MSWKASSVMEEKVRFVVEYERGGQTMTEVCENFGISRNAAVPGAGAGSLAFVACFHSEGVAPENASAVTAVLDAKFTLDTVRPASAWK